MQNTNHSLFAGDSGYPLEPWLLVPFTESEALLDSSKQTFNARHRKARVVIEQCNGLLKSRFRCLSSHRVLHYEPGVAGEIINACAMLHNICLREGVVMEEAVECDTEMFDTTDTQASGENPRSAAARIRDRVARQF